MDWYNSMQVWAPLVLSVCELLVSNRK